MADQEVPEEIQDYYQTERRERTGVAWLLAFGTLVVTILLAGGIFFGGRWAYRKFNPSESNGTPEIAQNDEAERERNTESATDENTQENQPDDATETTGGQGQDGEVQSNEDTNDEEAASPPATPTTGDDASEDLPDTGPASTVAIFVGVSVVSYLLHRFYIAKDPK